MSDKKNILLKNTLKIILVILLLTIIQTSFLLLVAIIPKSAIQKNSEESADYLLKNEVFFYLNTNDKASYIDRYADSILLNISYNYNEDAPLSSIMRSSYYYTEEYNENVNLKTAVTEQLEPSVDYMRYWHGSIAIVRPLLTFFNIQQIYILNAVVMVALVILCSVLIIRQLNIGVCICFLISMVSINIWYVPFSLEYTWTILLSLIACCVILLLKDKSSSCTNIFFLIIGSLTAYIDFLTTETITLMLPVILIITYKYKINAISNLKTGFKFALFSSIYWLGGYISAWLMKWTLASIILKQNVFSISMEHAGYRINGIADSVTGITRSIRAISRNVSCLFPLNFLKENTFFFFVLTLFIIFIFYYLFKKQEKCHLSNLLLILSLVPYVRYFVLSNHSYIHYFFTFRAQIVTAFCILLAFVNGINIKYFKRKKKNGQKK